MGKRSEAGKKKLLNAKIAAKYIYTCHGTVRTYIHTRTGTQKTVTSASTPRLTYWWCAVVCGAYSSNQATKLMGTYTYCPVPTCSATSNI
jgi:hypothetical protein